MWLCGIDEAGRGPVLGPLVIAICSIPSVDAHMLEEQDVDDSKKLSFARRNELVEWFNRQKQERHWQSFIIVCSPEEIDCAVYDKELNLLEAKKFAEAIDKGLLAEPSLIFADACDTSTSRFTQRIIQHSTTWNEKLYSLTSEHKADQNHRIVSMASILAKFHRDTAMLELQHNLDVEIGSGYPSDPKTRLALKELIQPPHPHQSLRWSWKTVETYWNEHYSTPLPIRKSYHSTQQSTLF